MIQNGQLYRLRWETDVVEIATEQMRVRVQRQECRITCFDSGGRLFAQDADMVCWRLGGGKKQIEADEHHGFGERRLLDKLAERKTNWTTTRCPLSDEMYQAIPFFTASRSRIWHFF